MTLTHLMEHQNVLWLLRTMHWVVIDTNRVSRRLMTSDRPVTMTNSLGRYDGHFAIPISPTLLLIAFRYGDFAKEFCALPMSRILRLVNEACIGHAQKYVYALDDSNAAQVRREMGEREPPSFVRDVTRDRD